MLFLLRIILYGIGIPAVTLAILFALVTSNKDITLPKWELNSADIHRAKSILYANKQASDKPLKG